MSENKFIAKLKGEPTPKSVVEIQNDRLVAPFKSSPMGHIADRDSSVVVAKGAQNWAVNQGQLVPVADDYVGTESDLTATSRVSGAGLWLNATYTFPATGDETNPVSAIIAPSAKWVLTLCGDSLITQNGSVITLTMLVKIGATHLTTKQFKVRECASQFSQRLAIDFSESEQSVIKAHGGSPLTVQVLCDDEGASATIYSGMTHLTLLQRKIDADLVATDNVLLPEFIENLLEGYIIPADYFSRYEYLEQVEDGGKAIPEFTRNGDDMTFTGWFDGGSIKNDLDDLGDQVSGIEEKIPGTASTSNPLTTKEYVDNAILALPRFRTQVVDSLPSVGEERVLYLVKKTGTDVDSYDEYIWVPDVVKFEYVGTTQVDLSGYAKTEYVDAREQDIRSDLNESISEVQTIVEGQATAIAGKVDVAGDTMTGTLNVPELNVATDEGTFNVGIVAGVATIATNNGLDIVAKTKFDTAPTTDDSTTWADALDTSLVRKAQVAAAIAASGGGSGGGASLPDQTGNAGKFLTTDGTEASWGDALTNVAIHESSLIINGSETIESAQNAVGIGVGAYIAGIESVGIGSNASCFGVGSVAIGRKTTINSGGWYAIAIGYSSNSNGFYSIQLGKGTNNDANTFKVGNQNGNFEMMSADGTIPADRMSATAGITGQVLTKTDDGMAWQDASGGGSSLPDQAGNEGKVLTTNGTDAEWTDMPGLIIRRL